VEGASALEYPEELVDQLADDPELKAAFDKLSPGRKRGYVLHFSAASNRRRASRASRNAGRRFWPG
jgi:uncharacterized protein YdeI (YjbR/CyaY-like superfamily)